MGMFSKGGKTVATVAVTVAKTVDLATGAICDHAKPALQSAIQGTCKVVEVTSAAVEPVIKATTKVVK